MGVACLPLLLAPRQAALAAVRLWARWVVAALALIVGLKVDIRGEAVLGPALVASKHQGMLDILIALVWLPDPCIVMKTELMWIPIFGWFSAKTGMIPIDRAAGASAVRALTAAATRALQDGRQLVIYPEGTRRAPGAEADYKPGIAALYRELALPCAPVATNSGLTWPGGGLAKYPGVAVYEALAPIPAGLKRAAFMAALEREIETACAQLTSTQDNHA